MSRALTILLFFISLAAFTQEGYRGTPYIRNYSKSEYNAGTQNWGIC